MEDDVHAGWQSAKAAIRELPELQMPVCAAADGAGIPCSRHDGAGAMALGLRLSLDSVSPFAPQKLRFFRRAKDDTALNQVPLGAGESILTVAWAVEIR